MTARTPQNHLVIFAKAPRLGRVKSRLARHIGAVGAWAFYRGMLAGLTRRLGPGRRWRCWLAVSPDRAVFDRRLWRIAAPGCPSFISQGGGDLGARMARVMALLPPGPVVLIGSDIPGIRPRMIARAFKLLGHNDAVFGPAPDGGYWLVGLKRRPRFTDPFGGVRWSTSHALADTRANLAGLRIALIDELEDVDDGPSFTRRKT
ncbi:MAG: TIGR04282 family arsenosugar biosynthesis glycosyltransferase [Rhodospirillales bacterium]